MAVRKTLIDYISEENYVRFNEILANCEERKKNAPKPERKPRGPMTVDQKRKMLQAKLEKAQKQLEELLAAE